MEESTREALELFVDKAADLAACRYVKWLQSNRGTALQISSEPDGSPVTQHTRPDRDATKALVLTFRFFIQKNEHCSFRWLSNNVVHDPGVSDEWKQGFTKIHNELNAWLDRRSSLNGQYEVESETRGLPAMQEHSLTHHEIMDVFIYGDFAHGESPKRKAFKRWKANSVWFEMAQLEFDYILIGALPAIWNVARLSEHELKRTPLSAQSTPVS
jgi:hypothetical protein